MLQEQVFIIINLLFVENVFMVGIFLVTPDFFYLLALFYVESGQVVSGLFGAFLSLS
jgi:hypothetical protein